MILSFPLWLHEWLLTQKSSSQSIAYLFGTSLLVTASTSLSIVFCRRMAKKKGSRRLPPFANAGLWETAQRMPATKAPDFMHTQAQQVGYVYQLHLPWFLPRVYIVGDPYLLLDIYKHPLTTKPDLIYEFTTYIFGPNNIVGQFEVS